MFRTLRVVLIIAAIIGIVLTFTIHAIFFTATMACGMLWVIAYFMGEDFD